MFISAGYVHEVVSPKSLLVAVDNHKPSLAIDENILDIVNNKDVYKRQVLIVLIKKHGIFVVVKNLMLILKICLLYTSRCV